MPRISIDTAMPMFLTRDNRVASSGERFSMMVCCANCSGSVAWSNLFLLTQSMLLSSSHTPLQLLLTDGVSLAIVGPVEGAEDALGVEL